jgi:hypothetical protein
VRDDGNELRFEPIGLLRFGCFLMKDLLPLFPLDGIGQDIGDRLKKVDVILVKAPMSCGVRPQDAERPRPAPDDDANPLTTP